MNPGHVQLTHNLHNSTSHQCRWKGLLAFTLIVLPEHTLHARRDKWRETTTSNGFCSIFSSSHVRETSTLPVIDFRSHDKLDITVEIWRPKKRNEIFRVM